MLRPGPVFLKGRGGTGKTNVLLYRAAAQTIVSSVASDMKRDHNENASCDALSIIVTKSEQL